VREQRRPELEFQLGDRRLEAHDFLSRFRGHFGIVHNRNELAGFSELVLGLFELGRQLYNRLEAAVLPAKFGGLWGVAERVRIGKQPLDLRRPGE
jgi:hypothetical protein